LAVALARAGQADAAEAALLEVLAASERVYGPAHPWLATVHHNLGLLYLTSKRLPAAEAALRSSLAIREAIAGHDPASLRKPLHALAKDIENARLDGLDVLQTIKREHPLLPVLMLSTYPEKQYAVRCIRLGACGYLNKSADPDDMLYAVRKAAGGGVFLTQATAEALAAAVGNATAQAGPETLSHREHQVYRLLTQGQTVSEIGAQLGLAPNTVSTYRARVLEKTGTKNDVELALYAERHRAKP
ncbi:MAG: LuxR C-terminal-related transcriptional regulator, partial [Hydrogenophaga sp.]